MKINLFILFLACSYASQVLGIAQPESLGSAENPVIISLLPTHADDDSETKQYQALFNEITQRFGIHFDVYQSESYEAAINDFCEEKSHISSLGPTTYNIVKKRCDHAELLAVEVKNGESVYFSGIFTHKKHGYQDLSELKQQSIAFGNKDSTSSFNYPLAMLLAADIQPEHDFSNIWIMGSHIESIKTLAQGKVTAAAASFPAWRKAIHSGLINPIEYKPLAKSKPIPTPPLAINSKIPHSLKDKIKEALSSIHTWENSEQLLTIAGRKIDRYDINFDPQLYIDTFENMRRLTPEIKEKVINKAEKSAH